MAKAIRELFSGSQGSSVSELQDLLNNNGYQLDTDGIFGPQTEQAVKDYQQNNGLTVDGIVGDETWGSLTNSGAAPAAGNNNAATPQPTLPAIQSNWTYEDFKTSGETDAANQKRQDLATQKPGDFSYDPYQKSEVVSQAEALLQQQLASKPGAYQSQWQSMMDDYMGKLMNRDPFSYNLNEDALYQQYKDQYVLQGQQAMMDTMGQASAMTGGYGNSYAQTAGQQTYQGYLQQLNDRVPELYQMALNQYNQEGQNLLNQYGMLADRENQDYGRYRDTLSDYNTELDRLTTDARYQGELDYNRYMDALNMAYGQHRDTVSDWQQAMDRADADYWNQYNRDYGQYSDDRNLYYQQDRDQISDAQWNQSLQYQQDRDKVSDSQWQAEFDENKRRYEQERAQSNKGSSSSGNPTGNPTPSPGAPYQNPTADPGGTEPPAAPEKTEGTVPDNIQNKAGQFNSNTDLANYLDGLAASGVITEQQADALYAQNKQVDKAALNNRDWTLVDDGGVNWFWGIDNNASVKDQYGNTYRMDKLVDALVADGMSKSAAKDYVKKLQAQLGA